MAERHEELNQPASDEEEETTEEPRRHTAEVSLGLEGVESQAEEDKGGDEQGLEDYVAVDVRAHCAEGE